jgi:DNA gyrase subunit B
VTDPDVDHPQIQTLWLTFFFRQMKEPIERGYLYVIQPPLRRIKRKRKEWYVDNDDQLNDILLELGMQDMALIRARNKYVFGKNHVSESVSIFSRPEQLGSGVVPTESMEDVDIRGAFIEYNTLNARYLDRE